MAVAMILWRALPLPRSMPVLHLNISRISIVEKGTGPSYSEAVDYLLKMDAADNINDEMEVDLMHVSQLSNKLPTEYAEALWNKELRRDIVYEDYVLKVDFSWSNIGSSQSEFAPIHGFREKVSGHIWGTNDVMKKIGNIVILYNWASKNRNSRNLTWKNTQKRLRE